MKKIYIWIVLLFTILSGIQVHAFDVQAGEDLYVTQEVFGDLYAAGGKVDVNAPINGDLIITGWELHILSDVKEDLLIAGWDLVISWNVWDDVRAGWGTVKVTWNIGGDLVIWAGDIRIEKGVTIEWDLIVWAWRVFLDGEVKWSAKIAAWEFVLNGTIYWNTDLNLWEFKNPGKTGRIIGNLNYKSDESIAELENISEWGVIFTKNMIKEEVKENFFGFIASYLLVKILWVLLFASLIYFYFAKLFTQVAENLRKQTGKSFLFGFVTIIGTPVVILLLFISIIWIPFALFLLFIYIFIFVFLSLINVIVLSSLIINKYSIEELYKKLLIILWFTLLCVLINGINIIVWFFTLWAIAIKKIDIIKSVRK